MPDRSGHPAAALLGVLREVLAQAAEPSRVLQTILEQAVAGTAADRGVLVEVADDGALEYRVLHRFHRADLDGEAGRYSRSVCAEVLESGETLLAGSAKDEIRYASSQSIQSAQLLSVLCVPIHAGNRIAALVYLESMRRSQFRDEHRTLLESLAEIAGPALDALQAGKSVLHERDELRISQRRFREEIEASRDLHAREWSFGRFIGRSAAVRKLETTVERAAATEFPLLLVGETGTGKSILARVLHYTGPRAKQAFVTLFCPSLEKGMVETELFGHKRGAFTGAVTDRIGKVQAAEKGTLFLDEIGEMPPDVQPKLLRLLQERTYERVGDARELRADVRVIAATNRDLEEEVRQGRFRRDLYERLNFIPIPVPPLRERREDIPLLLAYFLAQHRDGRWLDPDDDALRFLTGLDFSWPGNVRHVEQLAARLAMENLEAPITGEDLGRLLGSDVTPRPEGASTPSQDLEGGLPALLAGAEREWLEEALRRYAGMTRAQIAGKLRISESALYKKLRAHGLGG